MLIIFSLPRTELATSWPVESVRISSVIGFPSSSWATANCASMRSSDAESGGKKRTSSTFPIVKPASWTSAFGMKAVGARKSRLEMEFLFERIEIAARIQDKKTQHQQSNQHENADAELLEGKILLTSGHRLSLFSANESVNIWVVERRAVRLCR